MYNILVYICIGMRLKKRKVENNKTAFIYDEPRTKRLPIRYILVFRRLELE